MKRVKIVQFSQLKCRGSCDMPFVQAHGLGEKQLVQCTSVNVRVKCAVTKKKTRCTRDQVHALLLRTIDSTMPAHAPRSRKSQPRSNSTRSAASDSRERLTRPGGIHAIGIDCRDQKGLPRSFPLL